jgi:hypothetical protein
MSVRIPSFGTINCSARLYDMHLYIVVDCKTANCGTAHVLTYLGEKGKSPATVEYWMSYPLRIDCPTCGQTYDYSDSEERFKQKELPLGPPSEYFDRLSEPAVLKRSPLEEN